MYFDLLHDEAVLRTVAETRLECDGVSESVARGVEHGTFWPGEGRQALSNVLLGQRFK
jgi:hypothetical protein